MNAGAPPVGRLAPSPTGQLHLGHARSFLLAWWHARSRDGRVVLRLEDLDANRVRPEYVAGVLRDLEWLGLDWDGETLLQSRALEGYEEAVRKLVEKDLVYPCICTRSEIQRALSAPHAGEETGGVYPGTCRGRFPSLAEAESASGRKAALRFRASDREVCFDDLCAGPQKANVARATGDFPITTRAAAFAYQLAVVVDDARQGVTEVLRGDDLLPSAACQFLLQEALDLPHPTWIHVPLVVDATGRRLAKRSDDLALAHLRERGVAPHAIVSWAARSAGVELSGEALEAAEVLPAFRLEHLPPEPALAPALD